MYLRSRLRGPLALTRLLHGQAVVFLLHLLHPSRDLREVCIHVCVDLPGEAQLLGCQTLNALVVGSHLLDAALVVPPTLALEELLHDSVIGV